MKEIEERKIALVIRSHFALANTTKFIRSFESCNIKLKDKRIKLFLKDFSGSAISVLYHFNINTFYLCQ